MPFTNSSISILYTRVATLIQTYFMLESRNLVQTHFILENAGPGVFYALRLR